MRTRVEETVLRRVADGLPALGLHWKIQQQPAAKNRGRRPDAVVKIRHPEGELRLAAEIQVGLGQQHLGTLIQQLRHHHLRGLLIADYINPKLAKQLRDQDVLFLDAAGNAFLRGTGLYIWVTGQRNVLRLKAERERRRAFQPSGLRLIFTLLCEPELVDATYRKLADVAGVALGTVQWVMRDLIADGYVLRRGRLHRRLVEPQALLDAWTPPYARDLRPRLLLGRFDAPDLGWWKNTDLRTYGALWGGEPAAAHYTRFLKPQDLTIYAEEVPAKLVVEHRLKKAENGRIEFREKFWRFDDDNHRQAVPPILVYADLQALGDARTLETADRLRREHINGPFEQYLDRWAV